MVTEARERPVILFNPRLARCLHLPQQDLTYVYPYNWNSDVLALSWPITLFDTQLCTCSGDVGLGLNVRRMRNEFLSLFTVTYSLRPLGESGSVFRRYPDQWKVGSWGQAAPS